MFGEENVAETSNADTTKKQALDSTLMALKDTSKIHVTQEQGTQSAKNKGKTGNHLKPDNSYNEEIVAQKLKKVKKIKRTAEDYLQSLDTTVVKGFIYRVQISCKPCTSYWRIVKRYLYGPEQPEETYEDEWYKYSNRAVLKLCNGQRIQGKLPGAGCIYYSLFKWEKNKF